MTLPAQSSFCPRATISPCKRGRYLIPMMMTNAGVWAQCVSVSLHHALSYSHFPNSNTVTFDSRPQDLVYAPDESTLAVTCHDGYVMLHALPALFIHISTDVLQNRSVVFSGPLRGHDRCTFSIQKVPCSTEGIRPRRWIYSLGHGAFEAPVIHVFRTNGER